MDSISLYYTSYCDNKIITYGNSDYIVLQIAVYINNSLVTI